MSLFEPKSVIDFSVKAKTFVEAYLLPVAQFDKLIVSFYGEVGEEHRELMHEKAGAANKSVGKSKKVLGNDDNEDDLRSKSNKNRWKMPNSGFRFVIIYFKFL